MMKSASFFTLYLLLVSNIVNGQRYDTTKPFTRWWWLGSAVNEAEISRHLIEFKNAGLGGVEITPIYGVKGKETEFIDFMSDRYLEVLKHTTRTADSLGLAVDMVLGTGWPYGGPHVDTIFAASRLLYDTISFDSGMDIDITLSSSQSKMPVAIVWVDMDGARNDLWDKFSDGALRWKTPQSGKLYIFYSGKTGQVVKRSAPGGEGFTVDHYSVVALRDYLIPFEEKLDMPIRAIFNDSYEVYGTDFTPDLLDEFKARRGYDLVPFLPDLVNKINSPAINKVRCDYRETISDLLLEEFNQPWTDWAHSKSYVTRLQAHGSPGNLLDMYASADIPECETFGSMPFNIPGFRRETEDIRPGEADRVMVKFSSSAAHMMGKNLVSSETFTWLRDHFKVAPSQCKPELEVLLMSGVNHVFLHGSTYSPAEAEWPGWKFYASTNFAPQMNIWKTAPSLFQYIKNCQERLQAGSADNEIAVYYPVHDAWTEHHSGSLCMQFQINALEEWLIGTPFYKTCNDLMDAGYSIDYFSDRFLKNATEEKGAIKFNQAVYKAIVVPPVQYMPYETLTRLLELKKQGAVVIFSSTPQSAPGHLGASTYGALFSQLEGQILPEPNAIQTLRDKGIMAEMLSTTGLIFNRRSGPQGKSYFIANHSSSDFDQIISLNTSAGNLLFYDPETEEEGIVIGKISNGQTTARLQLKAGKSIFISVASGKNLPAWKYRSTVGKATILSGPFDLQLMDNDHQNIKSYHLNQLTSWTTFDAQSEAFSGTGTYTFSFKKPKIKADAWVLDLPDVRESAKVWLNGELIGTSWSNPFELVLPKLRKNNTLKIEVNNLDANRIRALEKSGKEWKIFYEINMVNKDYQKFDAAVWKPMPSGLIGQISLQAVKFE